MASKNKKRQVRTPSYAPSTSNIDDQDSSEAKMSDEEPFVPFPEQSSSSDSP